MAEQHYILGSVAIGANRSSCLTRTVGSSPTASANQEGIRVFASFQFSHKAQDYFEAEAPVPLYFYQAEKIVSKATAKQNLWRKWRERQHQHKWYLTSSQGHYTQFRDEFPSHSELSFILTEIQTHRRNTLDAIATFYCKSCQSRKVIFSIVSLEEDDSLIITEEKIDHELEEMRKGIKAMTTLIDTSYKLDAALESQGKESNHVYDLNPSAGTITQNGVTEVIEKH